MPSKLYYKIITSVGEESSQNNIAFDKPGNMIQVYLNEGWEPVGEISVTSVAGPKTTGSTKGAWLTRASQAIVRETDE